ncbi:MAG TPA: hemolysin III family protein, partial [Micromonosporaceae bacterium]
MIDESRPLRRTPRDLGKPRLRGWLHTYAFFVAVVAGLVLCLLAAGRPGLGPVLSCAIYSLTVCGLFGVSALYHRRVWTPHGFA